MATTISPMVISGTHALDIVMWYLEAKTPVECYARSIDKVLGPVYQGIDATAGMGELRRVAHPIAEDIGQDVGLFEGVELAASRQTRAAELAALPLEERLQRRIIDGEKVGLSDDLDTAMAQEIKPLAIINDHLLEGMKIVGELFGKGEMQLPFVLQSAEVMKTAVAYLEPFMEKTDDEGRGTMLLATVKGDVHDIGKNLVDIILSNNGYTVVNIGIKQTINQIIDAAQESNADAIRRRRQDEEMRTESKIVEKLEQSRMEDERRRAGRAAGPAHAWCRR